MPFGVVRLPSKGQLVISVEVRKELVLLRPQLRSGKRWRAHARGAAGRANRNRRLYVGVYGQELS